MPSETAQGIASQEALSVATLYFETQLKAVERLRTIIQALVTVGVALNSLLAKEAFDRTLEDHKPCALIAGLLSAAFIGFCLYSLRYRSNMSGRPSIDTFDKKRARNPDRERLLIAKGLVRIGDTVRTSASSLNRDFMVSCGLLIASTGAWLWLIFQTDPVTQ